MKKLAALLLLAMACHSSPEEPVALASTQKQSTASPAANLPKAEPSFPKGDHAVFSFQDNRHLAHLERGGLPVIVGGTPGFAKYTRFGKPSINWKIVQKQDDIPVSVFFPNAVLEFSLTAEQAKAKELVAKIYAASPQKMSLLQQNKTLSSVQLKEGWQTVRFSLGSSKLVEGENAFRFVPDGKKRTALAWIQVGGDSAEENASIYDAASQSLQIDTDESLLYYVQVPKNGKFFTEVSGDNCQVALSATAGDGSKQEAALQAPSGTVDLSSLSEKIVQLRLTASGCPRASLAKTVLTTPGAKPEVKRPSSPKYVIFWIMDSLRGDRIKTIFPSARPETPGFDDLATKGTIFLHAYTQGNESRVSHATMWTSLLPVNHKFLDAKAVLSEKFTTLDEAVKKAGMATMGVSANGYITKRWGFGTKWDFYRNHIHDGGGVKGEQLMSFWLPAFEKRKDKPLFAYLGTIDTHVSWTAREPWFSRYDTKPYKGNFTKQASGLDMEKVAAGKMKLTDRDKERIIAMYDSNVSYQDDMLVKLMKQLEDWGIADETMVILTADHGDELWEDKRLGHGGSQRETLIHVPLAIYYPPLFPAGKVVEGVDTMDILPTILDALGQPLFDEAQGGSLVPLAQGEGQGYPRPSFNSQYEFAYAMRLAGWKMRVSGANLSLYNIDNDHFEDKDLAKTRPIERRMLTDVMSTFLVYQKQWKKSRWGVASNVTSSFLEDLEK